MLEFRYSLHMTLALLYKISIYLYSRIIYIYFLSFKTFVNNIFFYYYYILFIYLSSANNFKKYFWLKYTHHSNVALGKH